MYNILIVDDEDKIRKLIKKYAEFEGYETKEASNGIEAIEMCKAEIFDIIIMDVMMPELDGFSAVKEIRKFKDTPVIMLTARGEEYDKIHGFGSGVDDYMVKPFSSKELMLRIAAILKRTNNQVDISCTDNIKHEVYQIDKLFIDFTARKVKIEDIDINMTPKEYDLLFYLVKNKNVALTREMLINKVWGYDFDGFDRTLDTHIKMLRKSLGVQSKYIVTLRSTGYRFEG